MFGGGDQMSVKEEASSSLFFIHPDIERVKNLLSVSLELLKTEIGLLDLDEKRKIALGEGLERLGQANGLLEHIISEHKEKEASEIQGKMEEICNTMYFYFSNSNLSKDRFLKREIERSEGGWIPLSLFTSSFNKIKSMTQNPTLVSRSIRSKPRTTTEWSLEISDDGTAVRRSGDLPNFDSDLSLDTTIYCHNIPRNSTHESLSSLFSQFGSVVYVSIPKDVNTLDNKGYAFVEFGGKGDAKKALDQWKLGQEDYPMVILPKRAWLVSKRKNFGQLPNLTKNPHGAESSSLPNFTPGAVLHVTSIGDGITRNQLRGVFEEFGTVEYVDHTVGQLSAYIRFSLPEEASKCVEELQKRAQHFEEKKFQVSVLSGKEEEDYWEKVRVLRSVMGSDSKKRRQRPNQEEGSFTLPSPSPNSPQVTSEVCEEEGRKKTDTRTRQRKRSKGGSKRTHIIFSEEPEELSSKAPTAAATPTSIPISSPPSSPPKKRSKKTEG